MVKNPTEEKKNARHSRK